MVDFPVIEIETFDIPLAALTLRGDDARVFLCAPQLWLA